VVASSDERSLAGALARLDDAALAHVLTLRGVSPEASWHDFFDAAEGLLSPVSVDRALTALPRDLLRALADGRDVTGLRDRMLLRPDDGQAFAVVTARLRELSTGVVSAAEPADPAPADGQQTAAAAEHAFTAVAAITDVLLWALGSPVARTGAGTVAVADRRRLIDAGAVGDGDELEDLIAAAADAGLLRDLGRSWHATAEAERWTGLPTPERWAAVAQAFADALPQGLRTPAGFASPLGWREAYPLDPAWPEQAARLLRRAERLGLLAPDGTEPAWTRALRETGTLDLTALAPHLPTEIDRIYLQADLSAIAPGPLLPQIERRLRGMAVRESRAQASTYRFSPESIAAAVAAGETAESLREFLATISLTGIPQPLAYLVDRAASRHGRLRVGVDEETGNTIVLSDDADLLATVAVDQALRPVGLVPAGGRLVSRAPRDAVYWSLFDARYPVVAVDGDGDGRALQRHGADPAPHPPTGLERYARLIAELRTHQGPDAEGAWLERELEQAVRNRTVMEVTVRLPDGSTRTFQLEATGLGGGRLRGRDRGADVERTLPLSSIESARPV